MNSETTAASRWYATSSSIGSRNHVLYQFGAVIAAGFAASFAGTVIGPLQETIRHAMGLSDNQIGILQGPTLYLPAILAAIPLGVLIDRFSRSRLLMIFVACDVLGTVLTAAARNFGTLLAARALIGLMISAIAMDASALLGVMVAPHLRGRTLMLLGFAQIAGISSAFTLGGKLAAHFGAQVNGWRYAILCLAVPLVVAFAFTLVLREPIGNSPEKNKAPLRSLMKELLSMKEVVLTLSVGPVVMGMSFIAVLAWAAPVVARHFLLPPNRVGSIIGTTVLFSGISGALLGGVVADLCQRAGGPRRTVTLLIYLSVLLMPAGLFAVTTKITRAVALFALIPLLTHMKSAACGALSAVVIPNHLRGLCLGVQNAVASIFISSSPVLVSLLSTEFGGATKIGEALALVTAMTSALGAATFLWGRRYFQSGG